MKMVIIEPLGVEEGKLLAMAREALGDRVEIVYYNTKTTDTAELIERGKDAEIIVVSNLPLNVQVIEGCRNLKLLAVAFTGRTVSWCATAPDIPPALWRIWCSAC